MAQAIVLPLLEKGDLDPEKVFGIVGREESVEDLLKVLPKELKVVAANNSMSVKVLEAPIQLLSVKPQNLKKVKEKLYSKTIDSSSKKPLLISIIAGVNLKRLQALFPKHSCVRAVPNAPVFVGAGLTGLSWGEGVSEEQRLRVKGIFNPISEVLELPEEQLDAFLGLTSSGPAYVALIAEALADGAVAAGLPRSLSNHLANRTLSGSALLLKEKELHPGQLKDMVASPAGTTITALRHLEMAGLRSALIEAVVLSAERSRELS